MVSTTNLLLLMLGLELLSLASYSLAGFHKGDKRSAEASLKYVIFGGLASGIMLYGISLLYGLTGTLDLAIMARGGGEGAVQGLSAQLTTSPVPVGVAIVLVLAGFAYKISAAPFHFWTPDVYQGAPTPVTTFLAVASKAAGFGALARFLGGLFLAQGVEGPVAAYGERIGQLLALLAAVTMTLGNLAAMRQESLKRMLAYSLDRARRLRADRAGLHERVGLLGRHVLPGGVLLHEPGRLRLRAVLRGRQRRRRDREPQGHGLPAPR